MRQLLLKYVRKSIFFLCLLAGVVQYYSCRDDIRGDIITQESIQVGNFLVNNPERYSEFTALVEDVGLLQLLNTYGVYTCFIPTNEAMKEYYSKKETSFEQLSDSAKLELVRNHLIRGVTNSPPIGSINFPIGSIPTPNMNEDFLRIGIDTVGARVSFLLNDSATIVRFDEEVHNGIVHTIDKVIESPSLEIRDLLSAEAFDEFTLFREAINLTNLTDSLYLTVNWNYKYEGKVSTKIPYENGRLFETPPFCKYGYTVFMESDEAFHRAGINSFDELVAYAKNVYDKIYPQDRNVTDYTDSRNTLNRFVSYHITKQMQDVNEFIKEDYAQFFVDNTTIYEYVETISNLLIEVQTGRFMNVPIGEKGNDSHAKILRNIAASANTMFLEISNVLTYEDVETKVLNKRLRMDVASLIPELITNKLRGDLTTDRIIPPTFTKTIVHNDPPTQFHYHGSTGWADMYGEEFLFLGKYDFTLRLPPVPPGRYEVRIGYTANPQRGVAQMFFDEKPTGIPLDMRVNSGNSAIGSVPDSETEDGGVENDKMMRNRGYLKGPTSIVQASNKGPLRSNSQSLRRIVTIVDFPTTTPHYLRIKSVQDIETMQFHLDYVEFVPSTYWEEETRD